MWERAVWILRRRLPRKFGIYLHWLTRDLDYAKELTEEWDQVYFGLAPDMAKDEVLRELPLDRVLLESDTPYFPRRRKGNEIGKPTDIFRVAERVAEEVSETSSK